MKLVHALDDLPESFRGGAVSIGNFDGVHHGHARIIKQLVSRAREAGGPAIVFTFDPHPVRLLRPELAPPPLTWTKRKAELLGRLGVDGIVAYPTDKEILSRTPAEFFDSVIVQQLNAQAVVEGPNFYFGRGRAGNTETLAQFCDAHSMQMDVVKPLQHGDDLVSSSRIRAAIAAGDIDAACELLTQPYRIRGMVTHGAARGAKIGFPTANLDAIDTLIPGHGVYAGRAVYQGHAFAAAINLGPNPTFSEGDSKVEVHLLDFSDNIYGEPLEVDFLARLRDIQPFPGVESLVAQLNKDVARAREIATS